MYFHDEIDFVKIILVITKDLVYFTTRVPDTSSTSDTRKNFDFDNDTGETIFSHPCISYLENERLQEEKQFQSKNYLLEMPCSLAKVRLKSVPQKLNFVIAKDISISYTLDCSCKCTCTFPHTYGK